MTEKEKFDDPKHIPATVYQQESQTLSSVLLIYSLITVQFKTKGKENQYICLPRHHQPVATELQFPGTELQINSLCFSIYISSLCIVQHYFQQLFSTSQPCTPVQQSYKLLFHTHLKVSPSNRLLQCRPFFVRFFLYCIQAPETMFFCLLEKKNLCPFS